MTYYIYIFVTPILGSTIAFFLGRSHFRPVAFLRRYPMVLAFIKFHLNLHTASSQDLLVESHTATHCPATLAFWCPAASVMLAKPGSRG